MNQLRFWNLENIKNNEWKIWMKTHGYAYIYISIQFMQVKKFFRKGESDFLSALIYFSTAGFYTVFKVVRYSYELKSRTVWIWNSWKIFKKKAFLNNWQAVMLFYIQRILVFSVAQWIKLFQSMPKFVQL